MTRQLYTTLIQNALEAHALYPDNGLEMFIGELGIPDYLYDIYGDDTAQLVADLTNIYAVANMTTSEIKTAAGLTVPQLAARFMIPLRTMTNWCAPSQSNDAPIYLRLLMAEVLGVITATITD